MTLPYLVGDLIAEFLAACDIKDAFGIISVHNIPMLDAINRQGKINFVMARNEMGAAHMADGYARAHGGLGCIFSSTGPGAANAVGGIVEAHFAGTPLLHITGQSPYMQIGRGQGGVHDVPAQLDMLKAVGKAAFRINSAKEALGVLTQAAVTALSGRPGPVTVEVPFDIQRTEIPRPKSFDNFVLPLPPKRVPDAAELDRLVEHIAKAKRPMLWLGAGARDASDGARRLMELGFSSVNSNAAHGVVPDDHPRSFGALNGSLSSRPDPIVEGIFEKADLIIVAGSRMRVNETQENKAKLPKNLVQIDIDPAANGRTYTNEMFVCADTAATLSLLADRLKGKLNVDKSFLDEVVTAKVMANEAFRKTLGPYGTLPDKLRAVMPRDCMWVRDVTLSNGSWGNKIFPIYNPRDGMYPIGLGIGPGLPLGIGAAVSATAQGRKTVMLAGDGGFAVNLNELFTAAQEKIDIVILVMNDNGYGVIKHIQDGGYGGRRCFGDLVPPDFAKLAESARIPYLAARSIDEVASQVAKGLAMKGPVFVECQMDAIGLFPNYISPPPVKM
ncbi:MAG: thiamine pyrophosphate-binding protein [Pseudomonadota bacterium]